MVADHEAESDHEANVKPAAESWPALEIDPNLPTDPLSKPALHGMAWHGNTTKARTRCNTQHTVKNTHTNLLTDPHLNEGCMAWKH